MQINIKDQETVSANASQAYLKHKRLYAPTQINFDPRYNKTLWEKLERTAIIIEVISK